jgi:hypothetical protein
MFQTEVDEIGTRQSNTSIANSPPKERRRADKDYITEMSSL